MFKVYNKYPELAPKYVHEIRDFAYNNTIHIEIVYIGIYKHLIFYVDE